MKNNKRVGFYRNNLSLIFLLTLISAPLLSQSQRRNQLFIDYGMGMQIIAGKIKNAKYSGLNGFDGPRFFMGFGVEHKITPTIKLCLNLNANTSKVTTSFIYSNDTDQASYSESNWHKDINYGIGLGLKYNPRFWRSKLKIGTGFNFQKLDPFAIGGETLASTQKDTFSLLHIYNFNNFSKAYNSFIFYLNLGCNYGRKKKSEIFLEFSTTLNKPVFGSDQYFYNYELIENSHYRVNTMFLVVKIRRRLF